MRIHTRKLIGLVSLAALLAPMAADALTQGSANLRMAQKTALASQVHPDVVGVLHHEKADLLTPGIEGPMMKLMTGQALTPDEVGAVHEVLGPVVGEMNTKRAAYAHALAQKYNAMAEHDHMRNGAIFIPSSEADYKAGLETQMDGWISLNVPTAKKVIDAAAPKIFVEMVGNPVDMKDPSKGAKPNPYGVSPHGIAQNRDVYPLVHPWRRSAPLIPDDQKGRLVGADGLATQFVADFLSIKYYKTDVLPRFGLAPIAYGPNPKLWDQELEQYMQDVVAATEAYKATHHVGSYEEKAKFNIKGHPEEGTRVEYMHPFGTAEDPTGRTMATAVLAKHGIEKYGQLFVADPTNEPVVDNGIDGQTGIPYTRNPFAPQSNLVGTGFYYLPGENEAIDAVIRVKDDGKAYYLMIVRAGSDQYKSQHGAGDPDEVALLGGMPDKEEPVAKNVFKELAEESGLVFDWNKLNDEKKLIPIGTGYVGGEKRQIATAGTTTSMSFMEFDGWADLLEYANNEFAAFAVRQLSTSMRSAALSSWKKATC